MLSSIHQGIDSWTFRAKCVGIEARESITEFTVATVMRERAENNQWQSVNESLFLLQAAVDSSSAAFIAIGFIRARRRAISKDAVQWIRPTGINAEPVA